MAVIQADLTHFENYMQEHFGIAGDDKARIMTKDELTPEQLFESELRHAQMLAEVRKQSGKTNNECLSIEDFGAFTDVVSGLRFEFKPRNRRLNDEEIASFQERYKQNLTKDTMWKILADMTCMCVLDGETIFHECFQAQKKEKIEYDRCGFVSFDFKADKILGRLFNLIDHINNDITTSAEERKDTAEKYQSFADMIQRITSS